MTKIQITQSKQTPEILFDLEAGIFEISGCSRPEDVELFYGPIIKKIELKKNLLIDNPNKLTIKIYMIYFNSSSLKFLLELLRLCIAIKGNSGIEIHWIHDKEDDDVIEVGEEIASSLNLSLTYIEKK